ncbi:MULTISPECIES: DMT family transporter [unclassified Corynebacterium]|uniref:DMT family transporter n=1 Tax=unclassified Corynebacterium TaxID=2624378 RepID=UPI0040343004
MTSPRLPALLAVTVTAVLWGTTGTAATFAGDVGPLAIGAVSLGVGGLLQALIAVPELRRQRALLRTHRRTVLLGGVAVFTYPLAFYSSMHLSGVAVGTVISLASAPLAAGLIEKFTGGARLGPWWASAAALGVTGAVLISVASGERDSGDSDSGAMLAGIVLGLVAGVSYAVYAWAAFRLMVVGAGRGAAMGSVFGVGGTLLIPVLLLTGAPILDSWNNVAVSAYIAVVPMFLGYVLFGYGLTALAPSTATTVTLLEPAVAALLAVAVVGERLAPLGWVGLALIALVLLILAFAPQHSGDDERSDGTGSTGDITPLPEPEDTHPSR